MIGDHKYAARLKRFGNRAERIPRDEYDATVTELVEKAKIAFTRLQSAGQLIDKESFGDIDLVGMREEAPSPELFKELFADNLLDYYHNGNVYDLLLKLNSAKTVQVDFIWARGQEDFNRKCMYYSKGPCSAVIGILAQQMDFKYGTEGFFKRFKDDKGNWHDVLVSESLDDGLRVLGLDQNQYGAIRTLDDIATFVSSSPFFDASDFQLENLPRRQRDDLGRLSSQDYVYQKLLATNKSKSTADHDTLFREQLPEQHETYLKEVEKINHEIKQRKAINGQLVMEIFSLAPGPKVGVVLKYLSVNHRGVETLTPELIEEIKQRVLR